MGMAFAPCPARFQNICEDIMNIGSKEAIREARFYRPGSLNTKPAIAGVCEGQGESPFPSRRQEARVNEQKVCAYGLSDSIDGGRVMLEQGEVYCLNRSEHGVLVLMGNRPRYRQLIELHVPETRWEHSLNLYEVQWTKAVSVESHGDLFLVGCRLVFGASRYWAF
jgi:hypothetical protein